MALATAEAIRDRIYTLIESLTPTSLSADKFRRYRNEGGAEFDAWAEKNAAGAFRRFQVRETSDDELPETSSGIEERVRIRYTLRMAYPQTHRYGGANAMDRDDVMNKDWRAINEAVGIYGGGNFTSTYDAIPLGATKTREAGQAIDYLVVTLNFEYLRSIAA
jgi:hypothetical protein